MRDHSSGAAGLSPARQGGQGLGAEAFALVLWQDAETDLDFAVKVRPAKEACRANENRAWTTLIFQKQPAVPPHASGIAGEAVSAPSHNLGVKGLRRPSAGGRGSKAGGEDIGTVQLRLGQAGIDGDQGQTT